MRAQNKIFLQAAFRIAKHHKSDAILFNLDCLDNKLPMDVVTAKQSKDITLIPVTQRSTEDLANLDRKALKAILHLPSIDMTRMSHVKIAVIHALSKQLIHLGDKIVFVTGIPGSKELDCLIVLDTATESEIINPSSSQVIAEGISPEVFQVVLNLSLELAHRGREGKPVGTCFVLGDEERVMQLSKQMVFNPFKGYSEEESHILNPNIKETIREFSAIDGAFIISGDGRVLAAGRYLNAASEEDNIPRGLGSRHISAGGITALTNAIAIVIAESSGDVRIFKEGKIFMEIEKSPSPKPN